MDFSQIDGSINSNINTGNISTDEFLAIFSSTNPTTVAGNGPGGGAPLGGPLNTSLLRPPIHRSGSEFITNVTLNPPLLTVDGQYTIANVLENTLSGTAFTLGPGGNSFINDSIFYLRTNFSLTGAGADVDGSSLANNHSESNYFNQTLWGNDSVGNNITEVHWGGRYPSGYTLTHIIIASIIVTILMIIIIVGNMLVIIAIATEKSLKNIQNWFIASLAVADFFLGLVIMPFSLANELMGYWIFGSWWCDIHSAMDVLLCTASIMNLCLISLDRYWSITKAVDYLKSRTPARAALMIAAVWIMSALICIPPLLGWKVKTPEGPLPTCELSEDIGYVLYSALGSFYIPSCIMVFVYIRIYFAAKARARRGIKKHPRKANTEQVTSFTTDSKKGTIPMPSSSGGGNLLQQHQINTIETPPNNVNAPMQIPTVTCDLASDISTSEVPESEPHPLVYPNGNSNVLPPAANDGVDMLTLSTPNCNNESLKVSTIDTGRGALNVPVPPSLMPVGSPVSAGNSIAVNNNNNNTHGPVTTCERQAISVTSLSVTVSMTTVPAAGTAQPNELRVSPLAARCRALSMGLDTDMVSEFDPSSSDSGVVSRCAVVTPLKFRLCQPIFGRKAQQQRRNVAKMASPAARPLKPAESPKVAELEPTIVKVQKSRDPEKEKRRIARKKEKRATLILGLIMGSFIACWLPFFFLYILLPACRSHCNIPNSAFSIAFWLGYMNSALNPAIYTIFNKDFRRAFRRILFK